MKIFHVDRKHGVVKLLIENLDDLWYLSSVVETGDLVKTKTERRLKAKDDIGRSKGGERKVFTLAVRVEKADFKSDSDTFRITGMIEQGPEDFVAIGSHHTFNVEKGTKLTIVKERLSSIDLDRLREAESASLRPKILIAVIDEGDATIGLVRESKIQYYELSKLIGGKYDIKGRQERKAEFYKDAAKFMEEIAGRENLSAIIVAGAGFEKENFRRFLNENHPGTAKKVVMEHIGSHGRNGVQEVMKRSGVQKVIEEITSARDVQMVHRLLEEIGKDSGLGIYGLKEVRNAVNSGAVEKLLICDDLFLEKRVELEGMMQSAKATRGEVHLINHDSEAGKQLSSLGGIGAVLRYRI
jgi:protein pelota